MSTFIETLKLQNEVSPALDAIAKSAALAQNAGSVLGSTVSKAAGVAISALGALGISVDQIQRAIERIDVMKSFEITMDAQNVLANTGEAYANAVNEFVTGTSYALDTATEIARQFKFTGESSAEMLTDMEAVLDITAAMAGGSEDTAKSVTRALTQMQMKVKLSAEEMRQLTNNNIPAWQLLADAMGMTVTQVQKLQRAQQIGGAEGANLILAQIEKQYGGMSKEMGSLMGSSLNNVNIAFTRMWQKIISEGNTFVSEMGWGDNIGQALLNGVKVVESAFNTVLSMASSGIKNFIAVLSPVLNIFQVNLPAGIALATGAILKFKGALDIKPLIEIWEKLKSQLDSIKIAATYAKDEFVAMRQTGMGAGKTNEAVAGIKNLQNATKDLASETTHTQTAVINANKALNTSYGAVGNNKIVITDLTSAVTSGVNNMNKSVKSGAGVFKAAWAGMAASMRAAGITMQGVMASLVATFLPLAIIMGVTYIVTWFMEQASAAANAEQEIKDHVEGITNAIESAQIQTAESWMESDTGIQTLTSRVLTLGRAMSSIEIGNAIVSSDFENQVKAQVDALSSYKDIFNEVMGTNANSFLTSTVSKGIAANLAGVSTEDYAKDALARLEATEEYQKLAERAEKKERTYTNSVSGTSKLAYTEDAIAAQTQLNKLHQDYGIIASKAYTTAARVGTAVKNAQLATDIGNAKSATDAATTAMEAYVNAIQDASSATKALVSQSNNEVTFAKLMDQTGKDVNKALGSGTMDDILKGSTLTDMEYKGSAAASSIVSYVGEVAQATSDAAAAWLNEGKSADFISKHIKAAYDKVKDAIVKNYGEMSEAQEAFIMGAFSPISDNTILSAAVQEGISAIEVLGNAAEIQNGKMSQIFTGTYGENGTMFVNEAKNAGAAVNMATGELELFNDGTKAGIANMERMATSLTLAGESFTELAGVEGIKVLNETKKSILEVSDAADDANPKVVVDADTTAIDAAETKILEVLSYDGRDVVINVKTNASNVGVSSVTGAPTASSAASKKSTDGSSASGGFAQGGSPWLVGERGPEIIVPDTNSMVINAHDTKWLQKTFGIPGYATGTVRLSHSTKKYSDKAIRPEVKNQEQWRTQLAMLKHVANTGNGSTVEVKIDTVRSQADVEQLVGQIKKALLSSSSNSLG